MSASVKTACREETCLAFALSRAQRVCNCAPQNVSLLLQSLQELWLQAARIPFQLIKCSHYFEKFSFQYLILFIFIYFAMSAFYSFSESSKYVQKPSTGTDETRFVLPQRMQQQEQQQFICIPNYKWYCI